MIFSILSIVFAFIKQISNWNCCQNLILKKRNTNLRAINAIVTNTSSSTISSTTNNSNSTKNGTKFLSSLETTHLKAIGSVSNSNSSNTNNSQGAIGSEMMSCSDNDNDTNDGDDTQSTCYIGGFFTIESTNLQYYHNFINNKFEQCLLNVLDTCDDSQLWMNQTDLSYFIEIYYIKDMIRTLKKIQTYFEINFIYFDGGSKHGHQSETLMQFCKNLKQIAAVGSKNYSTMQNVRSSSDLSLHRCHVTCVVEIYNIQQFQCCITLYKMQH